MKFIYSLLFFISLLFIWSAINPLEYFTWFLEVIPALIGVFVLIITFKKFRFTNLIYFLVFIHCAILIIGGHYTYAQVPLFNWVEEIFNHSRNNYDKLGHFAQGFVPAMLARELLIRKKVVLRENWLNFILVCIAMAISVTYEFIEWGVSIMTGDGGDSFLGTQGYIWDTQSDMLFATVGAVFALITLSKFHNEELLKLNK